jgi:uncharacterized Zn-binding protein involved in type VI secretion
MELGAKELSRNEKKGSLIGGLVGKAVSKAKAWVMKDDAGASPECPSPCGKIEEGSVDTFIGKTQRPVATVEAFKVSCSHHQDKPIRQGSVDVWVNNLAVARRTDETRCGSHVGEGEPTIFVGAETQTTSELDLPPVEAAVHQALDQLFGPDKGAGGLSGILSLGKALTSGKGLSLETVEKVLPDDVRKTVDEVTSSKIGQKLMKGDVRGAFDAVLDSFGF